MLRIYVECSGGASDVEADDGRDSVGMIRTWLGSFGVVGLRWLSMSRRGATRGSAIRRLSFAVALGSAKETRACLDVAAALGYLDGIDAEVEDARADRRRSLPSDPSLRWRRRRERTRAAAARFKRA